MEPKGQRSPVAAPATGVTHEQAFQHDQIKYLDWTKTTPVTFSLQTYPENKAAIVRNKYFKKMIIIIIIIIILMIFSFFLLKASGGFDFGFFLNKTL